MSDVIVLSGKAEGYRFESVNGFLQAKDIDASDGDTGTHVLTGAETARFDDRDIALLVDTVTPVGEVQVTASVAAGIDSPSVATLSDGGYVVTWNVNPSDGTGNKIYTQRYDADGVAIGGETQVNAMTSSYLSSPSVVALSDGGYFVTWGIYVRSDTYASYGQLYDANGDAVGGEIPLGNDAHVAALDGGGYAVVNEDFLTMSMSVTGLADGGYLVYYSTDNPEDEVNPEYLYYYSRRYDADGVPLGPTTQYAWSVHSPSQASIAALPDGGYVIARTDFETSPDDGPADIYLQRYDANGDAVGAEIRVNSTTGLTNVVPSVAALNDGGYAVVWATSDGIHARRFDASDAPVGDEILINTTKPLGYGKPSVVPMADGGYMVTWDGTDGIYTRRVDADGNAVEFEISGTAADDILHGGLGVKLNGLDGADTLDGDKMIGGAGNDTYIVDRASDTVFEEAGSAGGVDTVRSSISYTLGANVENLVLIGNSSTPRDGTGNSLDNSIIGSSGVNILTGGGGNDLLDARSGNDTLIGGEGNDTLNGGLGRDRMNGGTGNDLYYVDDAFDKVTESGDSVNGGIDTVVASVTFTLGNYVENLRLSGTATIDGTGNSLANEIIGNVGNNHLRGGDGNDTITGRDGNDILDGGRGTDVMNGGVGNDTYYVDETSDVVIESSDPTNGGIDTIISSVARTLGSYQENLRFSGSLAINGDGNSLGNRLTGNAQANILRGFSGNDVLNGGAGNDVLDGGLGNDVFILGDENDTVIDSGGIDTIGSTITRSLMDYGFIERLTLQGTANIDGTGNSLSNTITGNSGNNILDGGGGQDKLNGGLGNDVFILGAGTDTVIDAGGVDTIRSTITRSLMNYTEIERLTLEGASDINGTGNLLNNILTGSSGNNILSGAAGNDTLSGGSGNDKLYGGTGNDTLTGGTGQDIFVLHAAPNISTNVDWITDFSVADDTIWLENGVFTALGGAGALSSAAFVRNTSGQAETSSHRLIYETDTGELYYDSNGSLSGGSVLIATLDPGLALTNEDFWVI